MMSKTVFVTVGTTTFDRLIATISTQVIHKVLQNHGYSRLIIQKGRCDVNTDVISGLEVDAYQYKDSIAADMKEADLVISHAGAGSIMDALKLQRPLIVIINEDLMNNHQYELAEQLHADSHLLYGTCRDLEDLLENIEDTELKPYEPGQPQKFAEFLDAVMHD